MAGGKMYRYKPKRKTKRRNPKLAKLAVSALTKQAIGRGLYLPSQQIIDMRYSEHISLNPTDGQMSFTDYGANCIFDPFLGVGGHQPMAFDQWMTFYNHGTVLSSVIKVIFTPLVDLTYPTAVGIYLSDDQTNYTDYNAMIETGRSHTAILQTDKLAQKTITLKYNTAAFFKGMMGRSTLLNTIAANPTEKAVYKVFAQATDQASSTGFIDVEVVLQFRVKFFEPTDLAQS